MAQTSKKSKHSVRKKVVAEYRPPSPFKLAVRRFFNSIWVELAVGLLVVISVALTLTEMALETRWRYAADSLSPGQMNLLVWISGVGDLITILFVIELSLRFYAAASKANFFREFWIDILATFPLLRPLRTARALRLLRLVRIVRLFGVATRLSNRYPGLFGRSAADFIVVCSMLVVAVVFGTVAMMHFESHAAMQAGQSVPESQQFTLGNSFWYSIYTLFAGEPTPIIPQTISGRIVTVFIMFMGLTLFAIFAGTVSAYMVDRFRAEGKVVNWDEIFDHVVVCGWTSKTEIIIREYRADREFQMTPVVVVAQIDLDTSVIPTDIRDNVIFLNDDFTRVSALERAGIHRAKTCIILADTSGGRSEQDADARTILAALTVEKIAPQVQTSAELLHRTYGTHLDLGQVNSYVVSGEYGAYMLAQEAMNRGSMGVIDELLTCQRGNEFYRYPVLEKWVGMTFTDLMNELKTEHNAILVGVHPAGKKVIVNPVSHVFAASDQIVAISEEQIEF